MDFHLKSNETRWKRVEPEWRHTYQGKIAPAFAVLRASLPADEYDRIVLEWKRGEREIWLEKGFVMMSFTPGNIRSN